MTKQEWEKKLQEQGIDAHLDDQHVLMLKTSKKEEAIRFRDAIRDYPYSWGIKKIGDGDGQEDILSDTEDT